MLVVMSVSLPSFDRLVDLVQTRRVAVLTGAGCSTESGIPDYRGPETRARARNPMQYRQFIGDDAARRRYWSRSMLGWPRIRDARPNAAHRAIAALEALGRVVGVVTQNVDRLHHAAGTRAVELHGALADVRCILCKELGSREDLQARLLADNPSFAGRTFDGLAPDGDVDLARGRAAAAGGAPTSRFVMRTRSDRGTGVNGGAGAQFEASLERFVVPACRCGGVLKPDVVFFGEAVPAERVAACEAVIDRAEALLVVGSSLAVYSGLRVVRRAAARGLPCTLINLGEPERGIELFENHLSTNAGDALARLASALGSGGLV